MYVYNIPNVSETLPNDLPVEKVTSLIRFVEVQTSGERGNKNNSYFVIVESIYCTNFDFDNKLFNTSKYKRNDH